MFWAKLALLPIVSALIGWFTNYLAVKMIFRPYNEKSFLGFTFQGLIPKRRKEIALKIGNIVENELISHDDIIKIIKSADLKSEVESKIDNMINGKLKAVIVEQFPMAAMFIDALVPKFKAVLTKEIMEHIDELVEKVIVNVEEDIDFSHIVVNRIENFEIEKFEKLIREIASKELIAIEILGGILGFVIGIIQAAIIYGIR